MIKQKLMGTVVGLCLGLSAVTAGATGWPVFDVLRTAKFGGQGVERLLGLISEYQKTAADESEVEVLEAKRDIKHLPGKQDEEAKKAAQKGGKQVSTETFLEYWTGAKPDEMESNSLMPGKSDVKGAKDYLRDKYFLPVDTVKTRDDGTKVCESSVSEQERKAMKQKRQEYVEALSKETLSLASGARNSIASELSLLEKAETTGAAQVQQIDLMVQTKKSMIEQKIADLYLQTRLMEMESMSMLMGLSMQLVEEPTDGKDLCVNSRVWTYGGNK